MMSGIRAKDTKPELLIRSLLHKSGMRFRLHAKTLPGKPDMTFQKHGAVIFVHGCFWHGHGCSYFKWPKTRAEFWRKKIQRNRLNDRRARRDLEKLDWRVAVVWECAIRSPRSDEVLLAGRIVRWLKGNRRSLELTQ